MEIFSNNNILNKLGFVIVFILLILFIFTAIYTDYKYYSFMFALMSFIGLVSFFTDYYIKSDSIKYRIQLTNRLIHSNLLTFMLLFGTEKNFFDSSYLIEFSFFKFILLFSANIIYFNIFTSESLKQPLPDLIRYYLKKNN